ncbi:hypothetical protein Goshw_012332 [Gossypium schwendimanii]|uniref:Uncharacterized protein n=1 Tax=Gossypium schwendimanii TaxID=34291 RepID=A0A7J9NCR2_GOSSC|nr:hypothetical protein [Gossypium schwendimanii]
MGKKFQDTRAQEVALEKTLLVCQNKKAGLKVQVTELEKSLYQHRSRNSAVELKASLSKIKKLIGKERLNKIQQNMLESQKVVMNQLLKLLAGANDKGKKPNN